MNRIEQITGHPAEVQAAVDADLFTATRGPSALDRALAAAPRDELLARYRAALARINQPAALQPRIASRTAAAVEQRANNHQDRTWSA